MLGLYYNMQRCVSDSMAISGLYFPFNVRIEFLRLAALLDVIGRHVQAGRRRLVWSPEGIGALRDSARYSFLTSRKVPSPGEGVGKLVRLVVRDIDKLVYRLWLSGKNTSIASDEKGEHRVE